MVEGMAELEAVLLRRFLARLLLEYSGFFTVKLSSEKDKKMLMKQIVSNQPIRFAHYCIKNYPIDTYQTKPKNKIT